MRCLQGKKSQRGFTLMEVVVATTIFAIVIAGMTELMQYTLRINRKSEALRQTSQGVRNLVEFIAKEVRNGQIDYGTRNNGQAVATSRISPCPLPGGAGTPGTLGANTYGQTTGIGVIEGKDNRLGIINSEGKRECIYFAYNNASSTWINQSPTYPNSPRYDNPSTTPGTLALSKEGLLSPEVLLPSNVVVREVAFFIRPICDPYTSTCSYYGNKYPSIQPMVSMFFKFQVTVPTGEQVMMTYQTSVSTDKYDVPSN